MSVAVFELGFEKIAAMVMLSSLHALLSHFWWLDLFFGSSLFTFHP